MTFNWRVGIVAVLAAFTLAACGSGADSTSAPGGTPGPIDPAATLRVSYGIAPTSLDPHMASSEVVSFRFGLAQIYDRLFTANADGVVEGMLVDSFSYSEDGLSLTMRLREDVTFRDGVALDAEVVRANLERARTLQSPVVSSRLAQVTGVEAVGPFEVRLTLSEPTSVIPTVLSTVAGFIMHPDLVANGDPATEANGSGAYSVEAWTPGESLALVRDRTDYWDPEAAKIARFEYLETSDQQALSNALIGGQVDLAQLLPQNAAGVEGRDGLTTVMVPGSNGLTLYLNLRTPPLDRPEVRQAINHAYDRQAIAEALYPGSTPRWQQIPEGLPGFAPELEQRYPYDPELARTMLADAGFPNGIDLGEILVSQGQDAAAAAVQEQLAEVGVRFTPVTVDLLSVLTRYATGDYAAMLHLSPTISDPVSYAVDRFVVRQPGGPPESPEFQQLLATADDNRLGETERVQAYQALNTFLTEQAWSADIVFFNFPWVMSDRVQNFGVDMDYALTLSPYDFRDLAMTAEE